MRMVIHIRPTMSSYQLVVERLALPAIVIHGGAGAYVKTTTVEQRRHRGATLAAIAKTAHARFIGQGAKHAVLAAIEALEDDSQFNAGYGSRLQRDGVARLSCSLMDGARSRLSAVYNAEDCRHPSALANALQDKADRNLDGRGARSLMRDLAMPLCDVRSPESIERWRKLIVTGDVADREGAIGSAGEAELDKARAAQIPVPTELENEDRHGTVGAVACDAAGSIWACTSTGGRGHEAVGRISDSPTPAGNYACPLVALSATGFGEQILDLNLAGRIATRMLDGLSLESALRRTFDEVAAAGGLLGVIAIAANGDAGYAHTTEACGVAWLDAAGNAHVDAHGL
jgi:L-asparaginase